MRIGIIGTGYVGLVTGTCFAEVGHEVWCMDIDAHKISELNKGSIPIYEPGLKELVVRNSAENRLHFTTSMATTVEKAQIIFIAVGTPPGEDGTADLTYVLSAASQIAAHLQSKKIIVNKSTVPVGTGNKVKEAMVKVLQERGLSHINIEVVSNPEFLKEGEAVNDCMKPDRIVIGTNCDSCKEEMLELYAPFTRNGHPILFMDLLSAEITKYAANAMLASRISFMNEISTLCETVGADIQRVREGIGTDNRIGMSFLYAGLGFGGSCFPKDVRALAATMKEHELSCHLLTSIETVNLKQKERFLEKILKRYNGSVQGKTFAFWGLSFKPKTDDMREAPSQFLATELQKRGAKLRVYDPVAASAAKELPPFKSAFFASDMYDAAEGSDAAILITEWTVFRNPDFEILKRMLKEPLIFDGRNQFSPVKLKKLGFEYHSIGRP
jgi:UDPglucose 6-dehydrogenase